MTNSPADAADPDRITQAELDRLLLSVGDRFAPHLQAAAAAVREAEHALAEAQERLTRAEQAAADSRYVSDRLVFMRVTVREELDGLSRKTTPKKVRASFRHLLARAAELAEGEVRGYRQDALSARHEREDGVAACQVAESVALGDLEAAREMQQRVHQAEQAARDGIALLAERLRPRP